MAEASAKSVLDKISRGHLECPICCCRFNDPKTLDCLHHFCLKCLEEMMSNQRPGTKKIPCPVCRRGTQVPEGGLQSLTSSFFVISLVDEINKQEHLLGKTVKSHGTCESYAATPKCREHIDQPLCFYCETCDALICSMCGLTQHRSAEHKLIGITDAFKSFRKSVNDKLQKFEKIKEELASNEQTITRARNRLHKNLVQVRSEISAKVEAEIAKIRDKGELLIEKVNKIGQGRDSEYGKALVHNRDQMKRADQIVTAVNDVVNQANDFELWKIKSKVMHYLAFEKELKWEPENLAKAFIEVKCQDLVISDKDLGQVVLSEKWQLKKGTGYWEFKFASSVACFSNGDIVVTDTIQNRLSLFTSNGQYKRSVARGTGRDQLGDPSDVVVTSNDLLFVTDKKKVKVFDSELQFVHDFTPSWLPETELRGIAVDKQRVAVVDCGRKVITVHNLDGSWISSISNNMTGNYLAISNKDRLIFTNYQETRLLCVDFRGNEVFSVKPLLNGKPAKPAGVLCDDDGSIYVALHSGIFGYSEVHQYDSNGTFIKTVAQGLLNPCGMAFTPAGDVVVADKHSVKIFERM